MISQLAQGSACEIYYSMSIEFRADLQPLEKYKLKLGSYPILSLGPNASN